MLQRRLLTRRCGVLPAWVDAWLNQAEPAQLETWALRVLAAASLEEAFAAEGGIERMRMRTTTRKLSGGR